MTSQGVRLDGAGAYQIIPASTNGWHEVTIILEVDGRFSLQFDAERVDEGTADSRTIRTPLIGFDIGIMVSEANGASDFSNWAIANRLTRPCTPTSFRGRRRAHRCSAGA